MSDDDAFHDSTAEAITTAAEGASSHEEHDAAWQGMLHQLACYQMQNGHCFVPRHDRLHSRLGAWLAEQVTLFHKGRLAPAKQRDLEALGMEWDDDDDRSSNRDHQEARWEARFAEMVAFKEKHGHLRVTLKNQLSAGLMHWRDNQRIRFRSGVMPPEQRARLDAIGFEWEQPRRPSPAMEERNVALWESMFTKLLAFRAQHGHCQVPMRKAGDRALGSWVSAQRQHYRDQKLLPERQRRLEEIGFAWKSDKLHFTSGWEARFAEFVAFKEKHGHLRVTLKNQLSAGLMNWRDNQRIRFQDGVMPPEQKARLDAIGFEWEPPRHISPAMEEHNVALWESMFTKLLAFRAQHGHCQVPMRKAEDRALASWVRTQRQHYRDQKLLPERQRRLEETGFAWKSDNLHFTGGWEARFAEMVAFKEKHGHLRVTLRNQLSAGLMHWRDNQRIRFRSGVMPPEQKARLDAIGFEWEQPGRLSPSFEEHNVAVWEKMFERLLAFREQHGHCQVPQSKAVDPVLAKWVQRQRYHHKNNALPPERQQRLEEIGFVWKSDKLHFASGWEGRFAEMAAFKEKRGHLRITKTNEPSPGLSHWRDYQRSRLRSGAMKPEQKARLDALGFEWQPPGPRSPALEEHQVSYWEGMYARLAAFKAEQGHTRVPKRWQADRPLAGWLQKQRSKFRKGSGVGGLLPERLARLDELGTEWRVGPPPQSRPRLVAPRDETTIWEDHYARLAAFHRRTGHANVPGNPDRALRKWVLEQRAKHAAGTLDAAQITRLEALGFSWETPNLRRASPVRKARSSSIWDHRFAELQAFVAAHGHFRIPKSKEEFKTLRGWVVAQRVYRRQGLVSQEHREKLDALGFPWAPGHVPRDGGGNQATAGQNWDAHFRDLTAFKERHGHTRVPHHRGPDMKLGGWLLRQRQLQRLGRLPQDRFQRLSELGVEWNPRSGVTSHLSSDLRMAELRAFHAQHGHANVPTKYPPNKVLGNWVSNTRIARKKGQLSARRVQELDALGFRWEGERHSSFKLAASWEERFSELLEFQKINGHVNIRSTDKDHPSLADWVTSQRVKHRRGTLQPDRVQKLEAAGIKWGKAVYQPGLSRSWDQRYEELAAYRREHGHPHVSKADKAHHSLDIWAKTQRLFFHQGKLSTDQIQRLEAIGFSWDGREGWWTRQFRRWEAATQQRRTRHLTPVGGPDDDLVKWEQTQRNLHRRGQLSAEKARLLTRAGLIFESGAPSGTAPRHHV